MSLPSVSNELIRYLEDKFPLSAFLKVDSLTELSFQQGIHHLIDHLRSVNEYQSKKGNILNVR